MQEKRDCIIYKTFTNIYSQNEEARYSELGRVKQFIELTGIGSGSYLKTLKTA